MIGNSPQGILLILSGGVEELGSWGVGKNDIAWKHECMNAWNQSAMQSRNHAIIYLYSIPPSPHPPNRV